YFNRLIENPPDEFDEMKGLCLSKVLPNLRSENLAISCTTSLHHVELIEEGLKPYPDELFGVVVMTTGGNDLIHDYGRSPPEEGAMYGATLDQAKPWIDNYRVRLDKILDGITDAFPGGCLIFLADIYDPTDGVGIASYAGLPSWPDGVAILAQYNKIIHDAAKERENVILVPMHDLFLGHGVHCTNWWNENYCSEDPYYWYGAILEDPNHRGYDALRRLFLNKIVEQREKIK
ncbi:MAG: GDSL-type esterase/lipase family protein, partial [Planctomycetia bacterium]